MAFEVKIIDVSGCGLSRTVTAEITNTGRGDAHGVWAKVEVASGQRKIRVSGKWAIQEEVGTIKAGQAVIKRVAARFDLVDGLMMQRDGADIVLAIGFESSPPQSFHFHYPR